MAARSLTAALLTLALFGCAQTKQWQHTDTNASLDQDSQACAITAKSAYPIRMVGHRVVDDVATRKARENFKVAVSYQYRGQVKPPVVYRTRHYDINRHARARFERDCLRDKGWKSQRLVKG